MREGQVAEESERINLKKKKYRVIIIKLYTKYKRQQYM